jgi:hypothetical protein
MIFYDRLWHAAVASVTTTGAQTVGSLPLTRPDANGEGAEVWLQIHTTVGAVSATPTISYTNSAGVSGRTGTCIGFVASATTSRSFPFALDSGDTGVQSIQSITLGVSLVSGTIGLVIRRKVALVQVGSPGWGQNSPWNTFDAINLSLPRIYDDACLEILFFTAATSTHNISGTLHFVQG